jgi:hypothetical protein
MQILIYFTNLVLHLILTILTFITWLAGTRYTSSFGSHSRHQMASEDSYWKRRMPGVTLHVVSGMLINIIFNSKGDANFYLFATKPVNSCG